MASIDVRGGGPGTRETALLDPAQTVQGIDAIRCRAARPSASMPPPACRPGCKEQGRGFAVRTARVPIVPAAILFDLFNGGDKEWGRFPPYRELGYAAAAAAGADFALGSVGAGTGATTVNCKGGIGSASAQNAGRPLRSARSPQSMPPAASLSIRPVVLGGAVRSRTASSAAAGCRQYSRRTRSTRATKGGARESTTLVVVATDAILTKAQAKRLAVMAQSGLSRAIYPVHTPLDGDVVFAASTGRRQLADPTRPDGAR